MELSEREAALILYNRAPRETWMNFNEIEKVIKQWHKFERDESFLISVENPIPVWTLKVKAALKNLECEGRVLYKEEEKEYLFIEDLHEEFELFTQAMCIMNFSFTKGLPVFHEKIKAIADKYMMKASDIYEKYMRWYSSKREQKHF